ncbi:MAG: cyclic nucleotide-binding and patatin-like phospholipase domain-containing protein [Acidobacteriota bacterium]
MAPSNITGALATPDAGALVASSGCFGTLDDALVASLAAEATWVAVRAGEALFEKGDAVDAMYVVARGRLRAVLGDGEGGRMGMEIGRGEAVGEIGILTGEPRRASVVAVRDSLLLKVDRAAFFRLVARSPDALTQLARTVVRRLETGPLPERLVAIAVLPAAGDAHRRFARGLSEALGAMGRVAHVPFDVARGHDLGASGGHEWMDAIEADHDFVVYEGDPGRSRWNEVCARQADRLLWVAVPGGEPGEPAIDGPIEVREELVCLQPAGAAIALPMGPPVRGRTMARRHNVRAGHAGDHARVARTLTGRAVGLVLSGGGARAFAHVGVVRALAELGIPVDHVAGTSMGGFIAAQCARGVPMDDVAASTRHAWITSKPFIDLTVPLVSICRGRRLTRILTRCFGSDYIEDLFTPFFCVSTNLSRAHVSVHERGQIWRAVRASCSLPGVVAPALEEGDLLLDGGLLDNLPIAPMRERSEGILIACDVGHTFGGTLEEDHAEYPSAWAAAARMLNPWTSEARIPGIFQILSSCAMLGSAHRKAGTREDADLLIAPALDGHSLFDWRSFDAIVARGYEHAVRQVEAWLASHRTPPWSLPPRSA